MDGGLDFTVVVFVLTGFCVLTGTVLSGVWRGGGCAGTEVGGVKSGMRTLLAHPLAEMNDTMARMPAPSNVQRNRCLSPLSRLVSLNSTPNLPRE